MVHELVEGMDSRATGLVEVISRRLCLSAKFETGEGTCAFTCLGMLGEARPYCSHQVEVFGKLAGEIAADILSSSAVGAAPPNNSTTEERSLRVTDEMVEAAVRTYHGFGPEVDTSDIQATAYHMRLALTATLSKQGDGK